MEVHLSWMIRWISSPSLRWVSWTVWFSWDTITNKSSSLWVWLRECIRLVGVPYRKWTALIAPTWEYVIRFYDDEGFRCGPRLVPQWVPIDHLVVGVGLLKREGVHDIAATSEVVEVLRVTTGPTQISTITCIYRLGMWRMNHFEADSCWITCTRRRRVAIMVRVRPTNAFWSAVMRCSSSRSRRGSCTAKSRTNMRSSSYRRSRRSAPTSSTRITVGRTRTPSRRACCVCISSRSNRQRRFSSSARCVCHVIDCRAWRCWRHKMLSSCPKRTSSVRLVGWSITTPSNLVVPWKWFVIT